MKKLLLLGGVLVTCAAMSTNTVLNTVEISGHEEARSDAISLNSVTAPDMGEGISAVEIGPIKEVFGRAGTIAAVTWDNNVYFAGLNPAKMGLGIPFGSADVMTLTAPINTNNNIQGHVVDVAIGSWATLLLTDTGHVYSSGESEYVGRDNSLTPYDEFGLVDDAGFQGDATAISAGYTYHIVTATKEHYGWGNNIFGQLGNNDTTTLNFPVLSLDNDEYQGTIIDAQTSSQHTILLTDTGYVYSAGQSGKIGRDTESDIFAKIQDNGYGFQGNVTDISTKRDDSTSFISEPTPGHREVYEFASSTSGLCIVPDAYGSNHAKLVADSINSDSFTQGEVASVATSRGRLAIIDTAGNLYTCGSGTQEGVLANGSSAGNTDYPKAVVDNYTFQGSVKTAMITETALYVLDTNGIIYTSGRNTNGQLLHTEGDINYYTLVQVPTQYV